jgi:hypothetical protein
MWKADTYILLQTLACAAGANTRCVTDRGQHIARIVAMDEASAQELGWSGTAAVGLRLEIAPAEKDICGEDCARFAFNYWTLPPFY